jgi:YebC/PmpR family DNA-binding regulatory protein
VTYEGYGPGGTAILLQALTDNRNRTVSDLRNIFTRGGGSLGETGCVTWLFEQKGVIIIDINKEADAEELALQAIDAGADDVKVEDHSLEIYTKPEDLESVRKALEARGLVTASAELSMLPKTFVQLDEKAALQTLKLLDRLEDIDDVQHVFSNADFPVAVVEKYSAQV